MNTLYQTIGGVGHFIANIFKKRGREGDDDTENPSKAVVIEDESVDMDIDKKGIDCNNLKRGRSIFGDNDVDETKYKFPNLNLNLKRGRSIFGDNDVDENKYKFPNLNLNLKRGRSISEYDNSEDKVESKYHRHDQFYEKIISKKRDRVHDYENVSYPKYMQPLM
jgi:hypothetical protein